MIAAKVVFLGKYTEHTACARVACDLTDKNQLGVVKPQKLHPRPDISMLLATRKKEVSFRGGSFCDDKTNGCVRRLQVFFWISQTNKKFKSRLSLIVRVNVVLNGTVVVDSD